MKMPTVAYLADALCRAGRETVFLVTAGRLVSALTHANVQTPTLFAGSTLRQPVFDSMRDGGEGFWVVSDWTKGNPIMKDAFWFGVYSAVSEETLACMASVSRKAVRL